MDSKFYVLFTLFLFKEAHGHGAMYSPNPWWSEAECSEPDLPDDCKFLPKVPDIECYGDGSWRKTDCSADGGLTAWFTNFTSVDEKTIPDEYITKGLRFETSAAGLHPWNSPGSAPTWGNGCGANGGNPNGCDGEDETLGRCCGGSSKGGVWKQGCGGYVGGRSALEHYQDGTFAKPITTTWQRGSNQEVSWQSKAYHRGGYAYRLCKVNDGKVWEVTEDCFRNGHLKFAGDTTWFYDGSREGEYDAARWEAIPRVVVTEGTSPAGSEWAWLTVYTGKHSAYKDEVQVPEELTPGQYVLSFRWDCQQSPQVWNSCANIEIV